MNENRVVWLPDGCSNKPGEVAYILLSEYRELEAENERLQKALVKANTAPRWLIGREAAGVQRKGR